MPVVNFHSKKERMTFLFCGFVFDSSDEQSEQTKVSMPVQAESYSWLPEPAKINLSSSTTCNTWMSPYSRSAGAEAPSERSACGFSTTDDNNHLMHNCSTSIAPNSVTSNNNNFNLNHRLHNDQQNNLQNHNNNINNHNNNNNNGSGIVILDGCRPPSATTARRFLKWFSRIGQPPTEKAGGISVIS